MEGNPILSATAAAMMADPANRLYLSVASIWEIGIKSGLGKVGLSVPYATFLDAAISGYGLIVLPLTTDDCVRYESLPFPDPKHRDPFDRMLVTHALRDGLSVVGVDMAFDLYGVPRVW
jgi:PIN domain nuclease of toxin-antitoxin system